MNLNLTDGRSFEISEGETLYAALKRNGAFLVSPCGGKGTCGKCRVRVVQGDTVSQSHGRLSEKERGEGVVLGCRTTAKNALLISIPRESQLVLGGKIAATHFKDPAAYLKSYGVEIDPLVKLVLMDVPPPSIDDNTGDMDRLRREFLKLGVENLQFSHELVSGTSDRTHGAGGHANGLINELAGSHASGLTSEHANELTGGPTIGMADTLRLANWRVLISYVKDEGGAVRIVAVHDPSQCVRRFGAAIDIGTTTVVVFLVDLETGAVVDVGSTYNSQIRHGDDVITRIVHATEGGGMDELRDAVLSDINSILNSFVEKHAISRCDIDAAVVSGNTTMSQIFWGLNPASIREDPYIPTVNRYPLWSAQVAELALGNTSSPVYTAPCVASYVGGDIASGILASKMHRSDEIALFMDIGTNGEIVVGNNEWLMTAACSAGPCFEGGGIACGMRATAGAIESVIIDADTLEPAFTVIGGANSGGSSGAVSPIGICGSGMIDAIVEMYKAGIIDMKGIFGAARGHRPGGNDRVRRGPEGMEYVFHRDPVRGVDIVLTQVDIENLIRAKAAIYAGISMLIKGVGLTPDAIQRVYVAGGFGNFLKVEQAIALGMIPDMPLEKYVFLGNTSIMGSYLALLSDDLRREMEEIAAKMTYLELSATPGYMDEYVSAMFIPHTDLSLFPTARAVLGK